MDGIGTFDVWGVEPFFHTAGKLLNKPNSGDIKVDLIEQDTQFVLKVNLPGVAKKDVELKYDTHRDTLTINVSVDLATAPTVTDIIHFKERKLIPSTSRVIPFQHGTVDSTTMKAANVDGVLHVTVQKVESLATNEATVIKID